MMMFWLQTCNHHKSSVSDSSWSASGQYWY